MGPGSRDRLHSHCTNHDVAVLLGAPSPPLALAASDTRPKASRTPLQHGHEPIGFRGREPRPPSPQRLSHGHTAETESFSAWTSSASRAAKLSIKKKGVARGGMSRLEPRRGTKERRDHAVRVHSAYSVQSTSMTQLTALTQKPDRPAPSCVSISSAWRQRTQLPVYY